MENDLSNRIRLATEAFVDDMLELMAEVTEDAVRRAVADTKPAKPRPKKRAPREKTKPRVRARRRDTNALERVEAAALKAIEKKPGMGLASVADSVGVTAKAMQLPLKRLVMAKKVRMRGARRGATYWPRGK